MKLLPEQLTRHISANDFNFASTKELTDYKNILGQQRATQALEFGIGMQRPGFNLYVAGEEGMGRTGYVTDYLKPIAEKGASPKDWLYVNNFETPSEPRCLSLPTHGGVKFQRDIDKLIESLLATFPTVLENPTYLQQKTALQKEFEDVYDSAISVVEKAASAKKIAVYREDGAITFSMIVDGHIADEADFSQMNDADREQFRTNIVQLEALLNDALLELPEWQRELNNKLYDLKQRVIKQSIKPLLEELQQKYQGHAGVLIYLAQINQHLPKVIEEHFSDAAENALGQPFNKRKILEKNYRPHLLTRTHKEHGSPVVFESNPSYKNLFGKINLVSHQGGVTTDYQQIVAGALHRANEGYLLLNVEKILNDAETWEALKRTLREGLIKIESQDSDNASLKPEPIPLNTKIILIGSHDIYYALDEIDHDFHELFGVLVDFNSDFDCNADNLNQFAGLLHTKAKASGIAELSAAAIARLAEYACRAADHQFKLTTRIDKILDVVVEADYWRQKTSDTLIDTPHIETAIHERDQRHARLKNRVHEDILSELIAIATSGSVTGQINGLSIIKNGEATFGCPLRISATVHPGSNGVIDIEREVSLGQAIHSKGVLLLSGYLGGRYARNFNLAISAHIAVEQSYGYIDGDSASLAELCALLSAIGNIPLRQDIALTGSVSQFGEVQAIGGVNEKIEGFFDICCTRGLTGKQGVIIPYANKSHLMLAPRVIAAVEAGTFSVDVIKNVDEAMTLLTGKDMGLENGEGIFPEGSVNAAIVEQLKQFSSYSKKEK